jgi:hypothetical protein
VRVVDVVPVEEEDSPYVGVPESRRRRLLSVDDPRPWLTTVAVEAGWSETMLPRLGARLDSWGLEIEERDGKICIRDESHCEGVRPEPSPKLNAIRRLLDGEKKRRAHQAKQDAKAQHKG